MAEGRRRELWRHTSALLAMVFNMNRAAGAAARSPADFDPYATRESARSDVIPEDDRKSNFKTLKTVFVDRKGCQS